MRIPYFISIFIAQVLFIGMGTALVTVCLVPFGVEPMATWAFMFLGSVLFQTIENVRLYAERALPIRLRAKRRQLDSFTLEQVAKYLSMRRAYRVSLWRYDVEPKQLPPDRVYRYKQSLNMLLVPILINSDDLGRN